VAFAGGKARASVDGRGAPRRDRDMTRIAIAALALAAALSPALAQEVEPERCPRFVADLRAPIGFGELVVPASLTAVQAESDLVHLTFVGHATFLIESPAGVTIATDYNGVVKPSVIPRIVTMNRAHSTHYTLFPEPEIEYVFHGWGEDGEPARHELAIDDVWLRNVTTNVRGGCGMSGTIQRDMNSMFVFEVAGLCIAHLGHLHHELTEDHLKALGRVDVVLAPVDGSYTLNIDDMIGVLGDIGAPLVVPMHFFGRSTLERFLARLGEHHYDIQYSDSARVALSRDGLPPRQTVLVLPGY
jgi:L-ascorbate metabolism protein UlaG (beta-lactamase superfamily)